MATRQSANVRIVKVICQRFPSIVILVTKCAWKNVKGLNTVLQYHTVNNTNIAHFIRCMTIKKGYGETDQAVMAIYVTLLTKVNILQRLNFEKSALYFLINLYSLCYKWFAILHLGRFQFLAHQNRNVIVEQVVELVSAFIGVSLANV